MADNQFLALLDKEKPNILKMLPGDRNAAQDERARERWWAITYELSHNAALKKCADQNPMSLLNAVKKFADWGLVPDGEEGFINVYSTKQDDGSWLPEASPEAMYKGIIRRGIEAGVITHCVGDVLREGDAFQMSIGAKGRQLEIQPAPPKRGRKLIGGYAIFWLPNGLMDYELFDEDDIERVKQASLRNAQRKNKDAKLSPAWQYSEAEMVKAKVIKRGMKRMRGNRDTDAGRRFAEVTAEPQYDVEAESRELPPDNAPPDNSPKLTLTPEIPPVDRNILAAAAQVDRENLSISDADIAALSAQWRSLHGGRMTGASEWLVRHFGVSDFAELRADQAAECARLMAEGA